MKSISEKVFFKVDRVVVRHIYTISVKQKFLNVNSAEHERRRELALSVYYFITRNVFGVGVGVERIAHRPRTSRAAYRPRYLPVSYDLAFRNGFEIIVDLNEKVFIGFVYSRMKTKLNLPKPCLLRPFRRVLTE